MNKSVKFSILFEFSDDTLLVKIIKNKSDREKLQIDLNSISECCSQNELSLNLNKSELLCI